MIEEHDKNSERLFVKTDLASVLAKFGGTNVERKGPEANDPGARKCRTHARCPLRRMLTI
jgi:hypothetical protein